MVGQQRELARHVRRRTRCRHWKWASRVAPRASSWGRCPDVRIPGSSARHTRWQRTRGKRLCGRCWRGPAAVRHWRERSLSGRREALNSHRDKQGGRGQLLGLFVAKLAERCAHGLLVTAGAEPRTLITREAINMPPPRRMQNPTVMAIIMKRSDLEDGDPAEAELFAMTCFPPSVQDCSWLLIIPLCPSGTRGPPQAAFRRSLLFGSKSCVNPVVLTSRNIGVRGGSSVGFRKFTSNWYPRVGGL